MIYIRHTIYIIQYIQIWKICNWGVWKDAMILDRNGEWMVTNSVQNHTLEFIGIVTHITIVEPHIGQYHAILNDGWASIMLCLPFCFQTSLFVTWRRLKAFPKAWDGCVTESTTQSWTEKRLLKFWNPERKYLPEIMVQRFFKRLNTLSADHLRRPNNKYNVKILSYLWNVFEEFTKCSSTCTPSTVP